MAQKMINSDGVVVAPKNTFCCFRDFRTEGEKNFDQYYIEKQVKQVVRVTGTGEDDYVLENKEIINKTSIRETINAQADCAGMDAFLKPYQITGEDLPDVKVRDEVQDYTNAPETLADAIALGETAREKFAKLDSKLTKGMSYDEFLAGFTQKAFDEYIESLSVKEVSKKEGE